MSAGWPESASCRDAPPRFFTGSGAEQAVGKRRWCADCPVKTDCLVDSMADEEDQRPIPGSGSSHRWFLRGSLTAPEREQLGRFFPRGYWKLRREQRQAERRSA